MANDLALQFHTLFAGLERAHGHYDLSRSRYVEGQKVEGEGITIRSPTTVELWEKHLAGTYGIGVCPIRDDGTCRFGAIDIDQYDGLDHAEIDHKVQSLDLPLITCTTKSGGAHLYCFANEFVTAGLMRGKLMEWAVILGYGKVEVFPKQTRLASLNDWGSWINMPYFGSDKRMAIRDGAPVPVKAFPKLARLMSMTAVELKVAGPPPDPVEEEWFTDAPPCLQSMARNGVPEGSRNVMMFTICIYLRRRFGDDDWAEQADRYNQKFMMPALGHKELGQIIRNASKKNYEMKCDGPLCNRQICLTKKYGVGGGEDDPGVNFGTLEKHLTDPPLWIWDVDGARLELSTLELKDQNRFHVKCIELLNKWPLPMKPAKWAHLIRKALEHAKEVEAPKDASPQGHIWAHLERYCTEGAPAKERDELLLGKPWLDGGRVYFNSVHFKRYLQQNRVQIRESALWQMIRSQGAEHHFIHLKGRGMNIWSVPDFPRQMDDFATPEMAPEAM